jgi:large conductance mechanosensitive channel
MLKGFRDFIMRGNVVDLAVGIVIGAAFTALVASFTDSFIKPLIQLFGGGGNLGGTVTIRGAIFNWGGFITGLVTFIITAAVLYFLVVTPMNRLAERRKRGEEPEPKAPSEEVRLLTEIRDALVANATIPQQRPAPAPAPAPVSADTSADPA